MKTTILSNSLHQFLQIKHNLCLTYESLTSSYISNLGYITKYGNKLFGVTGTLGSDAERELLGAVFNLEFSIIPPYKEKIFQEFPGRIIEDEEFINGVAIAALAEVIRKNEYEEKARAVLIVCSSIRDVEEVRKEIHREAVAMGLEFQIKIYTDESEAHITEKTLDVRDIVIATNIAGRGTDFNTTPQLEKNGGLHVIEAFLPCNQRVQDQGLGRTSRQGNHGTGQIIARLSELQELGIEGKVKKLTKFTEDDNKYLENIHDEDEDSDDDAMVMKSSNGIATIGADYFKTIIEARDRLEGERIKDIKANKLKELEFKDKLFNRFASLYGRLKDQHKDDEDFKWSYVLNDLKEKWAFWLEEQNYTAEKIIDLAGEDISAKAQAAFEQFQEEAIEIVAGSIRHNPYYGICLAERYLEAGDKANRDKAKIELDHALTVSNDSELLYSAHMKLFEVAIENGGQALERFKKAVAKVFFITVDKDETYKAVALDQLQKAKEALNKEYDYLEKLIIGKESNETELNETDEFSVLDAILIQSSSEDPENQNKENIFLKHLQARQIVLGVYLNNIKSLLTQMGVVQDRIDGVQALEEGIIIDAKVPRYLNKLDPKNENEKKLKDVITDQEINEVELVGMNSIMQLRQVHDVSDEVITNAQWQIGGGLSALAITIPFPFLLPINGQIASALIGEGITDIIMALIDQGQTGFNKEDYTKGKIISYGISIVTMGIGAILSSTKILTKAMNACKNLASKLRAVEGPFAKICNSIANKLDKIVIYLELSIKKIEMVNKGVNAQKQMLVDIHKEASALEKAGKMQEAQKMLSQFQKLQKLQKVSDIAITHSQKLMNILKTTGMGAVKGVATSVAMEKIFTATLNQIMAGLKPEIEKQVKAVITSRINSEQVRLSKYADEKINEQLQILFQTSLGEDIEHVVKEISLGVLRHCNNWKMQIATLAIESALAGVDIATCTNKVCDKFFERLPALTTETITHQHNYDKIIEQFSEPVSGMIYGKIVSITGKVVITLPKAMYRGYKKHQEHKADKQAVESMQQRIEAVNAAEKGAAAQDMICGHNAVSATLGIDNEHLAHSAGLAMSTQGATKDDIKQMYTQNGINAKESSLGEAVATLQSSNSDRAVVCLTTSGDGAGHAVPVTLEHEQLMVTSGGKKTTLTDYQNEHGYNGAATVIIPEGVRAENLPAIGHQINRNRIVKVTHPVEYVGQGEGEKYGAKPGQGGTPSGKKNAIVDANKQKQRDSVNLRPLVDTKQELQQQPTKDSLNNAQKNLKLVDEKEANTFNTKIKIAIASAPFADATTVRIIDGGLDLAQKIGFRVDLKAATKENGGMIEFQTIGTESKTLFSMRTPKNINLDTKQVDSIFDSAMHTFKTQKKAQHMNFLFDQTKKNSGDISLIKTRESALEYWLNYQEISFDTLLKLRFNILDYAANTKIFIPIVIEYNEISSNQLTIWQEEFVNFDAKKILLPILISQSESLYHWIGLVITKDSDIVRVTYLDSENQPVSFILKNTLLNELQKLIPNHKFSFNQLNLETQRYNNCGPELVENFIYYLTGTRATQEAAPYLHSLLYEDSVLDLEFSASQIAENNRLIAELSNQMRPIYYMPSGYITREFLFISQSILKAEGIEKTALVDIVDNMFAQTAIEPEAAKASFTEAYESNVVSVTGSSSNDDNRDPENSKKPNVGLAEAMLNIRNGIEFIPVLSYFIKNIVYPIRKDILPTELANINFPEIHSSLLYAGHVGSSYVGALALNIVSPLEAALTASSSYGTRLVFKEVVHNIASFDLSNDINMAGYCIANSAFHFMPELMQLYYFINIGQFNYGSEIVVGLLKANSLTTMQRLTTASLECYNTYKQVHNLEEKTETKIETIIPYIADAIALGSSISLSYNPFFIVGNIVAADISSKIILKSIPIEIKNTIDLGLTCLGTADNISNSLTNIYDIYWQGIENENSIKTYKSCKTLFDSLMQFNWINNVYDFSSYSSYYTNKVIKILDNEKDQEIKENQNILSREFAEEKAEYMFKYINKPGLDIKYELLKQVSLGVLTEDEYQDQLQKISFSIDIGNTHYDLCISLNNNTNEDNNRLSYNCYSKENDIIDHIITDGAKLIGLYHLYSPL